VVPKLSIYKLKSNLEQIISHLLNTIHAYELCIFLYHFSRNISNRTCLVERNIKNHDLYMKLNFQSMTELISLYIKMTRKTLKNLLHNETKQYV